MSTSPVVTRRQHRTVRNDDAILDAGVGLAAKQGWAGLTPGHIAQMCGLSRPTVLHRHATRIDVGVALWHRRLWQPLAQALQPVAAAVNARDDAATLAALHPFSTPSVALRAAVELLVVSTYVPALAAVVESTYGAWLDDWISGLPDEAAARRVFAVGSAFGFVLGAQALAQWPTRQSRQELRTWTVGLTAAQSPVPMPNRRADLNVEPRFDTGDPTWDAVLRATIDSVSEVGYEAATIEVIAARCGYTRTVIFRRYPTKYDLFRDASARTLGPLLVAMDRQRAEVAEDSPAGVPDAWLNREVLRPHLRGMRTIVLEQVRLATHTDGLRSVFGDAVAQLTAPVTARAFEVCLGAGMLLMVQIRPSLAELPYDVVLIPWRQAQPTP